ncbi:MAG TPA: hypothetical protein VD694_00775, partial [Nitrososphaeraceae archaeon]|nr:hypothetical protein [Nitrososphaeraceae archaeon]
GHEAREHQRGLERRSALGKDGIDAARDRLGALGVGVAHFGAGWRAMATTAHPDGDAVELAQFGLADV